MKKNKILVLLLCFGLMFFLTGCFSNNGNSNGSNSNSNITTPIKTGITAKLNTFKTTYFIGEDINLSGSIIQVNYNTNRVDSVKVSLSMVSGFSSDQIGEFVMTIHYEGFNCTVNYTINEDADVDEDFDIRPETVLPQGSILQVGDNIVYGYTGNKKVVTIPSTYKGKPVKGISNAFYQNLSIEKVILSSNIKEIRSNAFVRCVNLNTVILNEGLEAIWSSFVDSGIEEIVLPSTLQIIGHSAFRNTKLKNINIPDSVQIVDSSIFYNCTLLESVSTKILGEYMFYNCNLLSSLTLREGVKTISKYAFYGCTSLTKIFIPSSVIEIGTSAFYSSTSKTIYSFAVKPPTLLSGSYHLGSVSQISTIYVPASSRSIYESSWDSYSRKISAMSSNLSVTQEGFVIDNGKLLGYLGSESEVNIPTNVTEISSKAFANSSLEKIIVPSTVKIIRSNAFDNSKFLKKVILHDELITIGTNILSGCDNIELLAAPLDNMIIRSAAYYFNYLNISSPPATLMIFEVLNGVTEISNELLTSKSIKVLILPTSITNINLFTFDYSLVEYVLCESESVARMVKDLSNGSFEVFVKNPLASGHQFNNKVNDYISVDNTGSNLTYKGKQILYYSKY